MLRSNRNVPFLIFAVCAVLWFAGFPWLTSDETGNTANVEWLISSAVALAGIVSLVWGIRLRTSRR